MPWTMGPMRRIDRRSDPRLRLTPASPIPSSTNITSRQCLNALHPVSMGTPLWQPVEKQRDSVFLNDGVYFLLWGGFGRHASPHRNSVRSAGFVPIVFSFQEGAR